MNIEILRDKVFDYLLEIPKGKITTYKCIGDIFEVHPRKIWKIIKRNENPEQFPCYKVLETQDKIGFYNGKGWIPGKVQKIKDDGIEVIDGKIDSKYFI